MFTTLAFGRYHYAFGGGGGLEAPSCQPFKKSVYYHFRNLGTDIYYTQSKKELNMNIHYLAGLFDGEGTITLTKRSSSDKYRTPTLSLTSTTRALVDVMQVQFGGWIVGKKTYKEHHKQAWSWHVTGNNAIGACEALQSHILEPQKKARMLLITETYKAVTPRNGKYSEDLATQKEQFERRFFEL